MRQYLLFENYWRRSHTYGGVRTAQGETYVEYESGEKEYYDLRVDPWQLENTYSARENAQRLSDLSVILSNLNGCKGANCRLADGGP